MSNFIEHSLLLLEDLGINLRYPDTKQVKVDSEGKKSSRINLGLHYGSRVLIEQNQPLKFLIAFSVLDFYIDSKWPDMEGKSFLKKYQNPPKNNDSEVIFSQLFRIAKLIRNTMVHNPSSASMMGNGIDINYTYKGTKALKINNSALTSFYTSLFIFIRNDFGNGEYFLGLVRSYYDDLLRGIETYNDEIEGDLKSISNGIHLFPYRRDVVLNLPFTISNKKIFFSQYDIEKRHGVLADFFICHNEQELLIPAEALDEKFSIDEEEAVNKWRLKGNLPIFDKAFLNTEVEPLSSQ